MFLRLKKKRGAHIAMQKYSWNKPNYCKFNEQSYREIRVNKKNGLSPIRHGNYGLHVLVILSVLTGVKCSNIAKTHRERAFSLPQTCNKHGNKLRLAKKCASTQLIFPWRLFLLFGSRLEVIDRSSWLRYLYFIFMSSFIILKSINRLEVKAF